MKTLIAIAALAAFGIGTAYAGQTGCVPGGDAYSCEGNGSGVGVDIPRDIDGDGEVDGGNGGQQGGGRGGDSGRQD
jgi:hypothetical protein